MTPFRITVTIATVGVSASLAYAQAPSPQPYGIKTFGAFVHMAMERDFAPKATLGAAIAEGATDGVGAVSDVRGEITIIDGKPIVTYGSEISHPAPASETAMLLVTAAVPGWQEIPVSRDVAPDEIDAFLAEQGKAHGIDAEKSFPFRLRGTLTAYSMHVSVRPAPGRPPFVQDTRRGDAIDGLVVGLYVAPELVGVATHPGERSHSHWISEDRTKTSHLDTFGIKSGSVLLLPKP
jgi:acetolactate decarboxylase